MAITHPVRHPRAAGFTMIEVLIAVLVLAIGLIGLAGIQAGGLRMNNSAYLRSQASVLAQDMVDRARANFRGYLNGEYNVADPTSLSKTPGCGTPSGCSPAALAATDVVEWNQTVGALLPGGGGTICRDGNSPDDGSGPTASGCGGGAYVVKIWWTDDRDGSKKLFATEVRAQ